MDEKIQKLIYDMLQAILRIEDFIGEERVFLSYAADIMLQQAVERNLEIIGEAMSQDLKLSPSFQVSNARRIVDARNKIIHGYDEIEPENIWSIVINHLPKLKNELTDLLQA
ncbi:MAG: DUF86 domain-containing protein [Cytophagales bacterium]|nr:DUF86 domain-containing protein [Cytophagales bacterium]